MLKNFTATDAWCPPKVDENQYLQVDLSRKTELTKIATQGQSGTKDRFVKTFGLLYSNDGKKWEQYGSKGKEKVMLCCIVVVVVVVFVVVVVQGDSVMDFSASLNSPK